MLLRDDISKFLFLGYSSVFIARIVMKVMEVTNTISPGSSKEIVLALQNKLDKLRKCQVPTFMPSLTSPRLENVYWISAKMSGLCSEKPITKKKKLFKKQQTPCFDVKYCCKSPVEPTYPNVMFDDINGFDDAKKEFDSRISCLKEKQPLTRNYKMFTKSLVLFGPPISQRRLLVHSLAGQAGVGLFEISDISAGGLIKCNGKWISDTEEFLINIKKHSPCVLFLDNLDTYYQSNSKVLDTLLLETDLWKDEERILVLAAVSKLKGLSENELKSHGLENILEIVNLNFNKRKELFLYHLSGIQYDITLDVDNLVKSTDGITAKQIKCLISRSARKTEMQKRHSVSMHDICYALLTIKSDHFKRLPKVKPVQSHANSEDNIEGKDTLLRRSNSTRTSIQAVGSFFRKR